MWRKIRELKVNYRLRNKNFYKGVKNVELS